MFIFRFIYRLICGISTEHKERLLQGFNIGLPSSSFDLFVTEGSRTPKVLNKKKAIRIVDGDKEWQQYNMIRYVIFYDGIFWECNPVGNYWQSMNGTTFKNEGERFFRPMFPGRVTPNLFMIFAPSLNKYRTKLGKNNDAKLHQYNKKLNIEKLINKI